MGQSTTYLALRLKPSTSNVTVVEKLEHNVDGTLPRLRLYHHEKYADINDRFTSIDAHFNTLEDKFDSCKGVGHISLAKSSNSYLRYP